jgi:filamentous hemagglutinin family protein
MKFLALVTILLIIISLPLNAEITLDGTLGRTGPLPGPNYRIGAELGQQHGRNLFHSFRDFNLKSHESATFSGPNRVNNIIGRVTGGNPSNIDGLIRSTIPNANLYFLNPYGIMFGPHAKLDVQGSFHASTADYLRLQDGGRFEARQPNNSWLTVAPVEAFGFLSDSPTRLAIENSQLSTYPEKTFSLVGGDITITGAQINAPNGRISLASVASSGEVIPTDDGLNLASFKQFGNLSLTDHARVTTTGKSGGEIYIRGGQLLLKQAKVNANTLENGNKGKIDIIVNRLNLIGGAQIGNIYQDYVVIDTAISSATISDGDAGDIRIKATESVTLTKAAIFANSGELDLEMNEDNASLSHAQGHAGLILIETEQLTLDNAVIESDAFSIGQGGDIILKVTGNTTLSDSHIGVNVFDGTDVTADRVGTILLETRQLDLTNVIISSSTFGSGTGGNITLKVDGSITLSQGAIFVNAKNHAPLFHDDNAAPPSNDKTAPSHDQTAPSTDKQSNDNPTQSSGDAGTILIQARELILTDRSNISSSTEGTGNGGHIYINATESVIVQNPAESAQTQGVRGSQGRYGIEAVSIGKQADSGDAGDIWLETPQLILTDRGDLNTSSLGGGDAGNIHLTVTELDMSNHAKIASSNLGSGNAGHILINAQQLRLQNAHITTQAKSAQGGDITIYTDKLVYSLGSGINTSVRGGTGDGGNITLESPQFLVLNQGHIKAQAYEGRGGNIHITSEQLIASPCSQISASSKLGIDGEVEIDAPEVNLDDFLVVLPGSFVDVSGQLQSPCTVVGVARNSFVVKRIAGSPPSPDDWNSNWRVLLPPEGEPRPNQITSRGSKDSKDASAGMAHNGLVFQPHAAQESSVVDEQLF